MPRLPFHELANEYRLLTGQEFADLANDIAANGLQVEIHVWHGQIVDGRNRYLACLERKVEPRFRDVSHLPENELRGYIASLNDKRRHETPEERQDRHARRIEEVAELRGEGKSLRAIAETVGVSHQQVKRDLEEATVTGVTVEPEGGKVTGRDGKKRAARKSKPKAKPITEEKGQGAEHPSPGGATEPSIPGEARLPPPGVTYVTPEPEAAPEDESAEDVPTDQEGAPLPPQAITAFGQVKELQSLCRQIDDMIAEVGRLGNEPIGVHLHPSSVQTHLKNAKGGIWSACPTHVCPYCKGSRPACRACQGQGWVTRSVYRAAPKD